MLRTAVPEAAIDEDCNASAWEYDIGSHRSPRETDRKIYTKPHPAPMKG
jgi:hypothetical protein